MTSQINEPANKPHELCCPECNLPNPRESLICVGCSARLASASIPPSPYDPMIGSVVDGRFKILERIGKGGMATVYRAEQTSIGRSVALKVLRPRFKADETFEERFRNEAALASRLNHPNTVILYDFGVTSDGNLYIAMELIDGVSVGVEIKRCPVMPWRRACRIAIQIAESLQDAHDNNIMHRDLKPENIMLTRCGATADMVKVLDFGIAKIMAEEGAPVSIGLTSPNQVFGTPEFMSPEQVAGKRLDNRTDIYSLGVILYRMITATLPFDAPTPMMMMVQHLTEPPKTLEKANAAIKLPSVLSELLFAMLQKRRTDRPATMRAVVLRLCEVLQRPIPGFTAWTPPIGVAMSESKPEEKKGKPGSLADESQLEEPGNERESRLISEAFSSGTYDFSSLFGEVKRTCEDPVLTMSSEPALSHGDEREHLHDPEQKAQIARRETLNKLVSHIAKTRRVFPGSALSPDDHAEVGVPSMSARQLVNVVISDTNLAGPLLDLVNSSLYQSAAPGKIRMVSRAVSVLGVPDAHKAATMLLLMETLKENEGNACGDLPFRAILKGSLAMTIAERRTAIRPADALVCAACYMLGRQIAQVHFPAELAEIRRIVEQRHLPEKAAAHWVLGVDLETLGSEILRQWGCPELISPAVAPSTRDVVMRPSTYADELQHLAGMASDLVDTLQITNNKDHQCALFDTLARHSPYLLLSFEELRGYLEIAFQRAGEYCRIVGVAAGKAASPDDISSVLPAEMDRQRDLIDDASSLPIPISGIVFPGDAAVEDDKTVYQRRMEQERIMFAGAKEINDVLSNPFDIEMVMSMILEAMYRGLNLSHAIFCHCDEDFSYMRGRFGFGSSVDQLVERICFPLRKANDLFSEAVTRDLDIVVTDAHDPRFSSRVPRWYREEIDAPAFLLYPIVIMERPVGLLYGDFESSTAEIHRELLDQLGLLRSCASRAIRRAVGLSRH